MASHSSFEKACHLIDAECLPPTMVIDPIREKLVSYPVAAAFSFASVPLEPRDASRRGFQAPIPVVLPAQANGEAARPWKRYSL